MENGACKQTNRRAKCHGMCTHTEGWARTTIGQGRGWHDVMEDAHGFCERHGCTEHSQLNMDCDIAIC